MVDLFIINAQFFTSHDINCWTGVVWIIVIIVMCSDGTHLLQSIH